MSRVENSRTEKRKIFARQCVGLAKHFLDFDPEATAEAVRKKNHPRKRFGASVVIQRQTSKDNQKMIFDGLEVQARKIGRVRAYRGFRKIVEGGTE